MASPLSICMVGNGRSLHFQQRSLAVARHGHSVTRFSLRPAGGDVTTVTVDPVICTIPLLRSLSQHRFLARAMRAVRSIEASLWHVHYGASLEGHVALAAGCRPLVVTAMGSDVLLADALDRPPEVRKLTRMLFLAADLVTSKASNLTDRLTAWGVAPDRIIPLVWGCDLDWFRRVDTTALRSRLGIAPGHTVVLSPRAVRPLYNTHLVLRGFARMKAALPDATLVIAGAGSDSEYGQEMRALARNLNTDGDVRWIGQVPHETMPELYSLADMCVSVPETDGMPQSVIEAMACGAVNILGDLPHYRSLVTADETAVMTAFDPEALAWALIDLATDVDRRRYMAAQGRRLVEDRCNLRTDLDRLDVAYRNVLARPRRDAAVYAFRARLALHAAVLRGQAAKALRMS